MKGHGTEGGAGQGRQLGDAPMAGTAGQPSRATAAAAVPAPRRPSSHTPPLLHPLSTISAPPHLPTSSVSDWRTMGPCMGAMAATASGSATPSSARERCAFFADEAMQCCRPVDGAAAKPNDAQEAVRCTPPPPPPIVPKDPLPSALPLQAPRPVHLLPSSARSPGRPGGAAAPAFLTPCRRHAPARR